MKKRAVVLDDDTGIRSLLTLLLEQKGFEVITCPHPLYCPVFLDHECTCPGDHSCTDILITDINMPHMTGLKFLKHQKKNGCKVKNIAVISGSFGDFDFEYARSLGCTTFKKPFQVDEIMAWVDSCEQTIDPQRQLSELPKTVQREDSLKNAK